MIIPRHHHLVGFSETGTNKIVFIDGGDVIRIYFYQMIIPTEFSTAIGGGVGLQPLPIFTISFDRQILRMTGSIE